MCKMFYKKYGIFTSSCLHVRVCIYLHRISYFICDDMKYNLTQYSQREFEYDLNFHENGYLQSSKQIHQLWGLTRSEKTILKNSHEENIFTSVWCYFWKSMSKYQVFILAECIVSLYCKLANIKYLKELLIFSKW